MPTPRMFSSSRLGEAFALVRRAATPEIIDVYIGHLLTAARIDGLPLPDLAGQPSASAPGDARHDLLALVPYRQLTERGLACVDDATPLRALLIASHARVGVAEAVAELPDVRPTVDGVGYDLDDTAYAWAVRCVLAEEIGRGAGSNFVLRRTLRARIAPYSVRTALSIFRRLLVEERGSYWTYLVHTPERTLVGATPERHVSLRRGIAAMTPISGTYRYPSGGPTAAGLLAFLADTKERDELSMVVDEELKMVAGLCPDGATVSGPTLREMARLAHTEFTIEGRTDRDVRAVLRATMFAPTVIGSPLPSACRAVARHEGTGRGYYGGVLALIGREDGERTLDSAICLRTADIDADGRVAIAVGATIVRGSDPAAEAAETTAKAAAVLAAVTGPAVTGTVATGTVATGTVSTGPTVLAPGRLADDPRIQAALVERRRGLSAFWFGDTDGLSAVLDGQRIVVVDAEDAFTALIARQLRALGAAVELRPCLAVGDLSGADTVVVGPGPGDPRDRSDPRIAALYAITRQLVTARSAFVSVCLGHQVLAVTLGLELRRRPTPHQGTQRSVHIDGRTERVGFYNSFAAYSPTDEFPCPLTGDQVAVDRDPATGEVWGLRLPFARSVQFHVESVLTQDGPRLLADLVGSLTAVAR